MMRLLVVVKIKFGILLLSETCFMCGLMQATCTHAEVARRISVFFLSEVNRFQSGFLSLYILAI